MSTSPKNCPKAQKKQTPPPPPVPVFAKIPCQRDQQAYGLHLEQHTQRWIADKLKCTQPTVLRGIRRMDKWLATTLPEDRGEYTATEKLRLALARHERLMERLLKVSLREFARSRKTIPMKKTITTTETTNEQGEKVKIRVEEWDKPQIGRKGFIDSAAKASHEITVLAAGWLGPGSGSISMAEVMDPEERDRWDRLVTSRDAQIKELQESRRVDAAERNARVSDECSVVNQPQSNAVPACISQSLMHPTPPREESATTHPAPVSEVAEKEPIVNQETAQQEVATFGGPTVCENFTDASSPQIDHPQNLYQDPLGVPPLGGLQAPAEAGTPAKSEPEQPQPPPTYRWGEAERQEALDYHCQINRLPRAKLSQASGVPDPLRISPLEHIKRGRPYIISIDYSEQMQRFWERHEREKQKRAQQY